MRNQTALHAEPRRAATARVDRSGARHAQSDRRTACNSRGHPATPTVRTSRGQQSECWHAIISESLLRLGDAHGTVRAAPADSLNRVCGLRTTSSPHASAAVDNSNAAMLRITNTADRFILIAPAGQLRRRGCSGRSDMDPAPIFWLRSGNPCMLGLWRDPDLPVSTGSWHTAPSSFAIRVGVAGVQAIEHGGHGFQQGVIVRLK
jgi:hypothetical protein